VIDRGSVVGTPGHGSYVGSRKVLGGVDGR
jgi:hypothetical protein